MVCADLSFCSVFLADPRDSDGPLSDRHDEFVQSRPRRDE